MTRYYYCYLLLLCLTACQPDNNDPDINIDISDELQIELWEMLDSDQRMLGLNVTTLEELDCENYSISFDLNQSSSNIKVSINNILPPHECISGTAPAANQVDLGHFAEGEYAIQLNLKNNEIVNLGRLKIKPRFYELDMESDYGIYLPWKTLKTVPEDLIWGYLTIDDEAADEDAMLEILRENIAPWTESIGLSQGEYGHFKIENGTAQSIRDQRETITENIFLWKQTGSNEDLRNMLDNFRSEYANEVQVRVFLSDGTYL